MAIFVWYKPITLSNRPITNTAAEYITILDVTCIDPQI